MRRSLASTSWPRGWAAWTVVIFGLVLLALGVAILIGGIWLIGLGGSWYYLFAGIGLIVSGVGLIAGSTLGVWLYLLTYVLTWAWALWEVGGNGWPLVPRVVAPTVLAILALPCLPALRRYERSRQSMRGETGALADRPREHAVPPPVPEPRRARRRTPERVAGLIAVFLVVSGILFVFAFNAISGRAENKTTVAAVATTAPQASGKDWPAYGGTYHALRYSSLDQINRDNVGQLKRVWTFRTGDLPDKQTKGKYSPETTPIKVGDRMYLCSAKNIIISLDAATGKEWWRYDPQVPDDAIPYGATCRGVVFYQNPNVPEDQLCATRIIEATLDARLIAVDGKSGKPCPNFGIGGVTSLLDGIGKTVPGWYGNVSAPTVVRNIIVVGGQVQDGQAEDAPSGVIRGYDAMTGRLAWAWDMGQPDRSTEPPAGQTYTRGTPNMWTAAAGDDQLGYVYVPLGNSAVDFYGGNRRDFENKYSSSLIAIDVTNGKLVWSFQTVHYDVWDYDLGSQPTLVDVTVNGGAVPAVVLSSKQGEIYVLDRRTGKSLFPVEERKVSQAGVETARLSPTQPFSTYHTLAKPPLTEKDMWGMSPLDQLWCRIQFRQAYYEGEYTPPISDGYFLQYPGYNGGSDWGSVSVDPRRGILVANYNNMPNYNRLVPRAEADKIGLKPIYVPHKPTPPGRVEYSPQIGSPYALEGNPGWRQWTGLLCTQPPYGGITAIELSTGKTLWDVPLGEARNNGPFGIRSFLPFTIGTPNNGGSLVTAGGLIFIAAATDDLIRAIDIETGKELWQDKLPAGGQATPMTFEADGRQFIGFMAGGHHFMGTKAGDYVLAYALPQQSAAE